MKRNIILSFDYELFFGDKSGTVEKTLILPTNMILHTMESFGLKGNFFVDVMMIKYLKKNTDIRSKLDLKLIENQLRDIVKRGHRIELHLHPHWVDAKYNGDGTWNYDEYRHYSLASFEEKEIVQMFKEGIDYLNALGAEIEPNYKVCAFRAGGWAVQPFSKLEKAFRSTGIVIDSSSAYGVYGKHKDSQYDFRNMPCKSLYHFEHDVCVESSHGPFIEVPITTFHRNIFDIIIDRIVRKISDLLVFQTDGTHIRRKNLPYENKSLIWSKLRNTTMTMYTLSFEFTLNFFFHFVFGKKHDFYCFIDHPKDFTKVTIPNIKAIGTISKSFLYKELINR